MQSVHKFRGRGWKALLMQAVAVALQCLSYDFVGTCLDESSEDLGTIQVRCAVHLADMLQM